MRVEEKVMRLLFGPARRKIVPLNGADRAAADFLMGLGAAGGVAEMMIGRGLSAGEVSAAVKRQLRLADSMKYNKYIYFEGGVFADCFAPRWPGAAMKKMARTMAENTVRESDEWIDYVPSLVFAITRKCVYRCEHCYAAKMLGARDTLSAEELLQIARGFQDIGVGVISWEGGEPLLRFEDRLRAERRKGAETEGSGAGVRDHQPGSLHTGQAQRVPRQQEGV